MVIQLVYDMLLLILFLITSHFIFVYGIFVTKKMLQYKSGDSSKILHIFIHGFLHGLGASFCLWLFNVPVELILIIGVFETLVHSMIDILKKEIECTYEIFKDIKKPYYWHLFQADQYIHITLKLFYIYIIILYIS